MEILHIYASINRLHFINIIKIPSTKRNEIKKEKIQMGSSYLHHCITENNMSSK